jgi:uncharacterized protein
METNAPEPSSDAGRFLTDWFDRLAREGWSADVFLAALSPDLVWTATGTSPVAGRYVGLEAYVEGVYRRLDERLEHWPVPHVERIIAQGDWGVVEFSSTDGVGKNGTDYSMRYCWLIRIVAGRVAEVVGYYDTQKVVELFA